MKLSKREKFLLILLGILLIVALFYMYGIMPAKDHTEEQAEEIQSLKEEFNKLNLQYIKLNTARVQDKIDKKLSNYYENDLDFWKLKSDTDLEKDLILFFQNNGVEIINTTGWEIREKIQNMEVDGKNINFPLFMATSTVNFKFEKVDDLKNIIEKTNEVNSLIINSISADIKEVNEEGNITIEYIGKLSFSVLMVEDPSDLPKEIDNMYSSDFDVDIKNKTIKFLQKENAEKYKLYQKIINEDGTVEFKYTKISSKAKDGVVTFDIKKLDLKEGKYEFAVEIIGDSEKNYFKSILSKCTKKNLITIEI